MAEAARHPHNVHRRTYVDVAGVSQPAPAPRFDRTPTRVPTGPTERLDTPVGDVLRRWS